ncbi:hypothetical protein ACP275_06G161700 [Erythranthe tilingii]
MSESETPSADKLPAMEIREESPAHFLLKIKSFSLLHQHGIHKYETEEFAAGEYKWKLIIYPNGDDIGKNCDHISVHLAIADTNYLPANGEVNAVFSIFLFNHNSGNFLASQGITRRFRGLKSQWGFSKFISKKTLLDPSNGYLVDGNCVFGAEVFIVKREAVTECLSLNNVYNEHYKHEFKISNFSELEDVWHSEEFNVGRHIWNIRLYPKGAQEGTGSHVGISLHYVGSDEWMRSKRVHARYTICIENQVDDEHNAQFTGNNWFSPPNKNWGCFKVIEIATINDPGKGFIVNDCCILTLEVSILAVVQRSPLT